MRTRLLRAALLAGVALDFLMPSGGMIQAHAQAGPTVQPGDAFGDQSPQKHTDVQVRDAISRQRLGVNKDGSINVIPEVVPFAVSLGRACAGTANAQNVVTIPVPAGMFAYITHVSLTASTDATGATVVTLGSFISTNTGPGSSTLKWVFSSPATANTTYTITDTAFTPPLRSEVPGTNVTFTSPSATADMSFCQNIQYYLGP